MVTHIYFFVWLCERCCQWGFETQSATCLAFNLLLCVMIYDNTSWQCGILKWNIGRSVKTFFFFLTSLSCENLKANFTSNSTDTHSSLLKLLFLLSLSTSCFMSGFTRTNQSCSRGKVVWVEEDRIWFHMLYIDVHKLWSAWNRISVSCSKGDVCLLWWDI